MSMSERIYSLLVRRDDDAEAKLPEGVRHDVARNGNRLIGAQALQSSGDQVVNASTVLPWLMHALGAPASLTGLLVPIRESGSMLPQALLTPLVLRARRRKWVFVAGAAVQAAMVAVMALTAAIGQGLPAGLVIIAALGVFSLGRCLCSIASKDVQGRVVPKGERGQITGMATTAAGLVAITLGLAIRVFGGEDLAAAQLAWLLAGGALLWVLVAAVYSSIREPAEEDSADAAHGEAPDASGDSDQESESWFAEIIRMLREDRDFRHFVTVRSFLLVSSLSPPFVVTLSIASGSGGLAGLGSFVIASGLASLLGGRIFGRFADRSSKMLMVVGAAVASTVIIAVVAIVALPAFDGASALGTGVFIAGYFLLTFMHTGVRVGRKTYLVDMATGDQRTSYVAVANTSMGIVLLIVGAISSAIAAFSVVGALVFLAALGLLGVVFGLRLPEVSAG